MPTFEITAPDGKVLEITAPEGASQDEVLAYAQAQYKPQEQSRSRAAAAPEAPSSPIEGMGGADRFLAGMGKSVVDTGRGLFQAGTDAAARSARNAALLAGRTGFDGVAESVTRHAGSPLADQQAENSASAAEARRLDAPLMDTGMGLAGNITGAALQAAIPAGGLSGQTAAAFGRAAPYVGASARGAAFAGAQPVVGNESRLVNAGVGALASAGGQGVASGMAGIASRARSAISPAVQRSIEAAKQRGIPLHLSQVTDSRFLKGLSSTLGSLPLTGAGAANRAQQEGFNRAVGRTFGADAGSLTDDVMQAARQKIGSDYDSIFSRNSVSLTPADVQKMARIEADALKSLTGDKAQVVRNQFQTILDDFANGPVDGAKYQSLREALRSAADKNAGGAGADIKALRGVLDDSAHRSVGAADAAALKGANAQWANLKLAEKALAQQAGSKGSITPANLWNLVKGGSTKDMRELAQIGQNVIKDPIPNSGTPERQLAQTILGLGGGGYLASNEGLPWWVRVAGGGVVAGRLMNSPLVAEALLKSRPASIGAKSVLAKLASGAPYALPAVAAAHPMEINVTGGRVGPAVTEAELEALRRRGRTP